MPVFEIGVTQQFDVPTVLVEQLPVGQHFFQLQVEDDANPANRSTNTAIVEVIVRDTERPTAVIQPVAPQQPGVTFTLDGSRSSDVPPGRVVRWFWTRVVNPDVPGPTPGPLPGPRPLPTPTPLPTPGPGPLPGPLPRPIG